VQKKHWIIGLTLSFMLSFLLGGVSQAKINYTPIVNPKNPAMFAKILNRLEYPRSGESIGHQAVVSTDGGRTYFQVSWKPVYPFRPREGVRLLVKEVIYVSWSPSGRYLMVVTQSHIDGEPLQVDTTDINSDKEGCEARSLGVYDSTTKLIYWFERDYINVAKSKMYPENCEDVISPKWVGPNKLQYIQDKSWGQMSPLGYGGPSKGLVKIEMPKELPYDAVESAGPMAAFLSLRLTKILESKDKKALEEFIYLLDTGPEEFNYDEPLDVIMKYSDQWGKEVKVRTIEVGRDDGEDPKTHHTSTYSTARFNLAFSKPVEGDEYPQLEIVGFSWSSQYRWWIPEVSYEDDSSIEFEEESPE